MGEWSDVLTVKWELASASFTSFGLCQQETTGLLCLQQLQDLFPQEYLYCPTHFVEEEEVGTPIPKGKHSP